MRRRFQRREACGSDLGRRALVLSWTVRGPMNAFDEKYWNLLREVVRSQFRLKDQSTFFGFLWSFLNPLVTVAVLFIFFNNRLGDNIEHYSIYLLIGVIHYGHFSNSTSISMSVLLSMKHLTANAVFPKELLIIGSVLSSSIEYILEMCFVVIFAMLSGVPITWALGMVPLVIALQIMLVLWGSLLLSCAFVFVRDIEHIYQVFLRLLFFITPIFYSPSLLGEGAARQIVSFNPLNLLMGFTREAIMEGQIHSLGLLGLLIMVNLICTYFAFLLFRRFEPVLAENV
jgi:ABC-type polysaccharide/polyol phosphate export permease